MKRQYIQAGSNCQKLGKKCAEYDGKEPREDLLPPFWDQCGCEVIEFDDEQLPGMADNIRNGED